MPRYTLCPYYMSEKRQTISCEDTCRRFKNTDSKWSWMDMYCDNDWMKCPYALDMEEAYRKLEKGDIRALDQEKINALQKENAKLLSALGRAEKRVQRQQDKIDKLRAVNNSYRSVNETVEKRRRDEYARRRAAEDKLKEGNDQIMDELAKMGIIYEQRMAYLIEQFAPDKILLEDDVEAWAGDKEFAIVHAADPEHGRYWKVVYKDDDKDHDSQDAEAKQE